MENIGHKFQVSSPKYDGPAYAVKYLGIVDGSMGVLSRKMAMEHSPKDRNIGIFSDQQKKLSVDHTRNGRAYQSLSPLLGHKYQTIEKGHPQQQESYQNIAPAMNKQNPVPADDQRYHVQQRQQRHQPPPLHSTIEEQHEISDHANSLRQGLHGLQGLSGFTPTRGQDSNETNDATVKGNTPKGISKIDVDLGRAESEVRKLQSHLDGKFQHHSGQHLLDQIMVQNRDIALSGNQLEYSKSGSQDVMSMIVQVQEEKISGYPQPKLYDQYYINKYTYPRGLKAGRRSPSTHKSNMKSLYDQDVPQVRNGFSGWKLTLTKRQEEILEDNKIRNELTNYGIGGSRQLADRNSNKSMFQDRRYSHNQPVMIQQQSASLRGTPVHQGLQTNQGGEGGALLQSPKFMDQCFQ